MVPANKQISKYLSRSPNQRLNLSHSVRGQMKVSVSARGNRTPPILQPRAHLQPQPCQHLTCMSRGICHQPGAHKQPVRHGTALGTPRNNRSLPARLSVLLKRWGSNELDGPPVLPCLCLSLGSWYENAPAASGAEEPRTCCTSLPDWER